MRILPIIALAASIPAAPAFAQEKTTLEWVTTKGVILKVAGAEIPVTYTPDGRFTAMDGQVTGAWRIVGETLCNTSNFDPSEQCVLYPQGMKPGDEFEVVSPQGAATIQINR